MPVNRQTVRELSRTTLYNITSSGQAWRAFLDAAARLYKYSFPEQVLIYAQEPEATACAAKEVWYPDLMLEEPEAAPGKYGLLRLRYLEKSDPDQLNILLLEGALNSHLAQIDRQVRGQVEQTMERLVQRTRLPDKQTDPLGWAGTMNSLRQQAEETAMELIYGS